MVMSTHTLADLRPGDIGFGPIHGAAGLLVNAGQLLLGEGFHVGGLDIRHVFVVTEPQAYTQDRETGTGRIRFPQCVEAMPSGAREATVRDRWTPEYAYVRPPEDYPGQAADAAAIARAMIGTPYSFASYAALALWRFEELFMRKTVGSTTWRGEDRPGMGSKLEDWINRRKPATLIEGHDATGHPALMQRALPREAICSVLADQAWSLAGKKIMEGVAHQCVTPGALAGRLLRYPGAEWIWPS